MKADNTLRNILIGLTIVFSRIPLITAAYLLSETDYNFFNKFYYTASIIVIFSSFGFDFAWNYAKSKLWVLAVSVLINVILSSAVILLVSPADWNNGNYVYVFVFAYLTTLSGILVFRVLFTGNYIEYFIVQLVSTIVTILVLVVYKKTGGVAIIYLLPTAAFLTYALVHYIFTRKEKEELTQTAFNKLYHLGSTAFVINGIVPLLLAADKYIVNQHFASSIANSYTFAWALAAPMFYIGNTSEKVIYSENKKDKKRSFVNSFWVNTFAMVAYLTAMFLIINYYDGLLPKSLNIGLLKEIIYYMLPGYGVYCILHFPINGYLFKYQKTDMQKNIAIQYLLAGLAAVILFNLMKELIYIDYRYLILFNFIVLLGLIIIKITAIWKIGSMLKLKYLFAKREHDEL